MTPKHNINIPVERHQNDSKVCYQSIGCQYINRSVKLVINGPVLKLYILRTVDFRILGPKTRTDNIDIFIYANIYICLYPHIQILIYPNNLEFCNLDTVLYTNSAIATLYCNNKFCAITIMSKFNF